MTETKVELFLSLIVAMSVLDSDRDCKVYTPTCFLITEKDVRSTVFVISEGNVISDEGIVAVEDLLILFASELVIKIGLGIYRLPHLTSLSEPLCNKLIESVERSTSKDIKEVREELISTFQPDRKVPFLISTLLSKFYGLDT